MIDVENALSELNRLRWQCRRGMLELDEILMRYLERDYPDAAGTQRRDFVALLTVEDPLLNRWLILGERPAEPFVDIVRRVRTRED